MNKTVYTFDDMIELLSEHAIGTEAMQNIEQFCQRKQDYTDLLLRRLRLAEQLLGSHMLDEQMMYE